MQGVHGDLMRLDTVRWPNITFPIPVSGGKQFAYSNTIIVWLDFPCSGKAMHFDCHWFSAIPAQPLRLLAI